MSACKNPLKYFSPRLFEIILIDYLPKGQTQRGILLISAGAIEGDFEVKTPSHGKVTKGVLFMHDNAPAHRALASQKKLAYLGF
jgi:hypothetical protein